MGRGPFFLGWQPDDNNHIHLYSIINCPSTPKICCCLFSRNRVRQWFINVQKGHVKHFILYHPQPSTTIHCNNSTAMGIANSTVKQQLLGSIKIQYFCITDQVKLGHFNTCWHSGQKLLAIIAPSITEQTIIMK